MTSDPTYTPSPELVEAVREDVMGLREAWWGESATQEALSAAVAFRTPTGDPELVPWEQVRELVEAARELLSFCTDEPYPLMAADIEVADHLRAALAPFTQEPEA